MPVWRSDAREIFYLNCNAMMAVAVNGEEDFQAGTPELLFEGRYYSVIFKNYDVSLDGQRFLMVKPVEAVDEGLTAGQQIVVVENWFEELKRLVPTN